MSQEEWLQVKQHIKYDYIEDNHFAELKNSEIVRERLQTLNDIENSVGVYYSKAWIKRNILKLNDQEIEDMQKEMDKEKADDDDFGPGGGAKPDAPWNALATRPGYIAQPGDEPTQQDSNSDGEE